MSSPGMSDPQLNWVSEPWYAHVVALIAGIAYYVGSDFYGNGSIDKANFVLGCKSMNHEFCKLFLLAVLDIFIYKAGDPLLVEFDLHTHGKVNIQVIWYITMIFGEEHK